MFATAEDHLSSSSSSGSLAQGPSTTEMIPKEMRFFDVGPKEENGYAMDHSKDEHFSDLEHPYSPHHDTIIIPHKHYHCRMCDQEFENKSDMQRHAKDVHRMDEKSHKCQKCLKSFPSSQQLAQHLLVHTNVRKYSCKFCDKMFKQLSHVQQHLRIHTGERPYKCTVDTCPKSFRQLSSLQQHIKGHNIPLPKSYPISKTPSHHYSTNNQIIARPHDLICQVCERHCENDSMFFEHLQMKHPDYWKVLSGEHEHSRPEVLEVFVCPCCSLEFSHVGELKRHQDHEHPDDQINHSNFNICVCQKIFNNDSQFIKHLQLKGDFQHQEKYKEVIKKMHSSNLQQFERSMNGVGKEGGVAEGKQCSWWGKKDQGESVKTEASLEAMPTKQENIKTDMRENKEGDREGEENREGYREGEENREGYREGEENREGDREGEENKEGYRKGEENREGDREGEENREGYKEGEENKEGYREGEENREGYKEGEENREGDKEEEKYLEIYRKVDGQGNVEGGKRCSSDCSQQAHLGKREHKQDD